MRIGDHLLDDPVASGGIGIGDPVTESAFFRIFELVLQIPPLLMAKCFPVGNQELEITRVGAVHIGVVNLIDDAVAQREPDAATGMIRGADSLFGAAGPPRLDAGGAKGGQVLRKIHESMFLAFDTWRRQL